MAQEPRRTPTPEPPFTSDKDEWRRLGRDLVKELPRFVVNVAVCLAVVLIWNVVATRYPLLVAQIQGETLVMILVTAFWLLQVAVAFRSGRRRLHHSAP